MSHAHLEALHTNLEIPFDEMLTVRANKRQIIEGLGFSGGTNPTEFVNVVPGELLDADMESVLTNSLDRGLYSALLIEDGQWQHMGGAPVVYVMGKDELAAKLAFGQQGNIQRVETTNGTYIPTKEAGLKIFARKKSVTSTTQGFENYTEPLNVGMGGGFRLQIDEMGFEDRGPFLTMSAHFSFNDYGSRVLAKENEEDARVPIASKSFRVPIVDGKLDLPLKDLEYGGLTSTDEVIDLVLSELFATDGEAINNLTRQMLTVRPAMQIHQFEGIYGVTDEYGISAEVIDFDGLDIFDLAPMVPNPGERLAGKQLIQSGFLRSTDNGAAVTFHQHQSEMRVSSVQLSELEEVSDGLKVLASLRSGEDITAYANRLNTHGRLARSLSYVGLHWTSTSAPNVVQSNINGWKITKVEVGGFESAYIERDGDIVPVRNAKEIYDLTRHVFGSNILRLYVTLSIEGD